MFSLRRLRLLYIFCATFELPPPEYMGTDVNWLTQSGRLCWSFLDSYKYLPRSIFIVWLRARERVT